MRKRLLLAGIFLMCFSLLKVQKAEGQAMWIALLFGDKVASEKFNLSLEAGGTFANLANYSNMDRSKMGINFGMAGNLKVADNWYLSPNIYFLGARHLNFSALSLETGDPGMDGQFVEVPTKAVLKYIDIPVFFSYETNNKKFRFGLAPQVSFFLNAKATYTNDYGDFTHGFSSYINKVDYGGAVDFCYVLGKAHKGRGIHLHARYYQGFSDIFNDKLSSDINRLGFFSLHLSLPFITDELAAKNLEELRK